MGKPKKIVKISSINGGLDILDKLKEEGVNSNYVFSYKVLSGAKGEYLSFKDFKKSMNLGHLRFYDRVIRVLAEYVPRFSSQEDKRLNMLSNILANYLPETLSSEGTDVIDVRKGLLSKLPHSLFYDFSLKGSIGNESFYGPSEFNVKDLPFEEMERLRVIKERDSLWDSVASLSMVASKKSREEMRDAVKIAIGNHSVNLNQMVLSLVK
jgi:hypothetical protein